MNCIFLSWSCTHMLFWTHLSSIISNETLICYFAMLFSHFWFHFFISFLVLISAYVFVSLFLQFLFINLMFSVAGTFSFSLSSFLLLFHLPTSSFPFHSWSSSCIVFSFNLLRCHFLYGYFLGGVARLVRVYATGMVDILIEK